jgi:hypothetical protein
VGVELLDDHSEQVSSAQIVKVGALMATLAAALLALGYPVLSLAVGPLGLTWVRKNGGQVRRASWFLATGASALVTGSVFTHDGWESALALTGALTCLGGLAWRKYRPVGTLSAT